MFEILFRSTLWLYEGAGAWYFVTVPADLSARIHAAARGKARAWGSLPVTARIGGTRWKTSVFWDRKRAAYLLPVKAAVRAKEQLRAGDLPEVMLVPKFAVEGDGDDEA